MPMIWGPEGKKSIFSEEFSDSLGSGDSGGSGPHVEPIPHDMRSLKKTTLFFPKVSSKSIDSWSLVGPLESVFKSLGPLGPLEILGP